MAKLIRVGDLIHETHGGKTLHSYLVLYMLPVGRRGIYGEGLLILEMHNEYSGKRDIIPVEASKVQSYVHSPTRTVEIITPPEGFYSGLLFTAAKEWLGVHRDEFSRDPIPRIATGEFLEDEIYV